MVAVLAAPAMSGGGMMGNPWSGFARWLDAYLDDRNVSNTEFAAKVGVVPSTVSRWRNGFKPDASRIARIAQVTGENELELLRLAGVAHDRQDVSDLPAGNRRVIARLHTRRVDDALAEVLLKLLEGWPEQP
jgi:transcriptional regulator with XRE-family HTH domain